MLRCLCGPGSSVFSATVAWKGMDDYLVTEHVAHIEHVRPTYAAVTLRTDRI